MGIQGSGKGTHAKMLAEASTSSTSLSGTSSGERAAPKHQARRAGQAHDGGGLLVGDDLVDSVVKQRLSEHDWNYGFIIDGFRATSARRSSSWKSYDIDGVIHLDLPDSEVARRVLARRLCAGCGMDYSLLDNSPASDGRCDACGGELVWVLEEPDGERRLRVVLRA